MTQLKNLSPGANILPANILKVKMVAIRYLSKRLIFI